eukprot:gene29318-35393_t
MLAPSPYLPSEKDTQVVARLRAALAEKFGSALSPKVTDTCILRFYRGFKEKEDVALAELIKHQEWRVANNADTIHLHTDEFLKAIEANVTTIGAVDRNGRPASYNFVHRHVTKDRDITEMRKFIIYIAETMLAASRPEEERFVIVMDLKRFTLACMDYEVVKALINILQINYSETLEKLHVVDAPFIFSACWALIRPWLDPVTAAKVHFIKREQLKDYFTEENIFSHESTATSNSVKTRILSTSSTSASGKDDSAAAGESGKSGVLEGEGDHIFLKGEEVVVTQEDVDRVEAAVAQENT